MPLAENNHCCDCAGDACEIDTSPRARATGRARQPCPGSRASAGRAALARRASLTRARALQPVPERWRVQCGAGRRVPLRVRDGVVRNILRLGDHQRRVLGDRGVDGEQHGVAGVGVGLLVLLLCILLFVYIRRNRVLYAQVPALAVKRRRRMPDEWEIERERPTIGKTSSEGAFGSVSKALYQDRPEGTTEPAVDVTIGSSGAEKASLRGRTCRSMHRTATCLLQL
jgi:hypothetical protein